MDIQEDNLFYICRDGLVFTYQTDYNRETLFPTLQENLNEQEEPIYLTRNLDITLNLMGKSPKDSFINIHKWYHNESGLQLASDNDYFNQCDEFFYTKIYKKEWKYQYDHKLKQSDKETIVKAFLNLFQNSKCITSVPMDYFAIENPDSIEDLQKLEPLLIQFESDLGIICNQKKI